MACPARGGTLGGGGVKVRISEISEEGLTLSESFDPAALGLGTPDLRFTEPVQVTAVFRKQQDLVLVSAVADGQTEQICGRCLEKTPQDYSEEFQLDYSVKGQLDLDVTDDIRQEILLSLPVIVLCQEDCQGLCPRCGTNLNERRCEHASSKA